MLCARADPAYVQYRSDEQAPKPRRTFRCFDGGESEEAFYPVGRSVGRTEPEPTDEIEHESPNEAVRGAGRGRSTAAASFTCARPFGTVSVFFLLLVVIIIIIIRRYGPVYVPLSLIRRAYDALSLPPRAYETTRVCILYALGTPEEHEGEK